MAFDFKKEYKEFYMPKRTPSIVTVPKMNFIAVRGSGDPNDEEGVYKQAIGLLYGIAFTIKMSKKGDHQIDGYFDYVVPPLEGFWWQNGVIGVDYTNKDSFQWISVIRLPDFVTKEEFDWAVKEAAAKKKQDFSKVEFFTYDEGLCVQCMHIGSYDDEPATVQLMHDFMEQKGYELDITDKRLHHEIYLSDARKTAPEKLRTLSERCQKNSAGEAEDGDPSSDKSEGEMIIWSTSELQRKIWKRSISAAPFPTIRMFRCHRRRCGCPIGLMRDLSF